MTGAVFGIAQQKKLLEIDKNYNVNQSKMTNPNRNSIMHLNSLSKFSWNVKKQYLCGYVSEQKSNRCIASI